MEDITIHSDHCPINFQLSTALGSIFHLQCRLRSGKKALEKMRYTEVESSQSIDQQSIDKLHIGVIRRKFNYGNSYTIQNSFGPNYRTSLEEKAVDTPAGEIIEQFTSLLQ